MKSTYKMIKNWKRNDMYTHRQRKYIKRGLLFMNICKYNWHTNGILLRTKIKLTLLSDWYFFRSDSRSWENSFWTSYNNKMTWYIHESNEKEMQNRKRTLFCPGAHFWHSRLQHQHTHLEELQNNLSPYLYDSTEIKHTHAQEAQTAQQHNHHKSSS